MSNKKLMNVPRGLFSGVKLTAKVVWNHIEHYRAVAVGKMTFGGLLTSLYLTYEEFEALCKSDDVEDMKVVKLLLLFKQDLEAQLEQKLIYQDDLPKFYNHQSLQFVMKKMNPKRYGDKVLTYSESRTSAGVDRKDLVNTSGISFVEKHS